jgi:hypothetical protein
MQVVASWAAESRPLVRQLAGCTPLATAYTVPAAATSKAGGQAAPDTASAATPLLAVRLAGPEAACGRPVTAPGPAYLLRNGSSSSGHLSGADTSSHSTSMDGLRIKEPLEVDGLGPILPPPEALRSDLHQTDSTVRKN